MRVSHILCMVCLSQGKGIMETFWLKGRKDMSEANDSMVCVWKPKKLRVAATSNSNLSQVSDSSAGADASASAPSDTAKATEKSSESAQGVETGSGPALAAVLDLKASRPSSTKGQECGQCSEVASASNGFRAASGPAEDVPQALGTIPEGGSNTEACPNTGQDPASSARFSNNQVIESALRADADLLSNDVRDWGVAAENAATTDGQTSQTSATQAAISTNLPDWLNTFHGVEEPESSKTAKSNTNDLTGAVQDLSKTLNHWKTESQSKPRDTFLAEPVFSQSGPEPGSASGRVVDKPAGTGGRETGYECCNDPSKHKVRASVPKPWSQSPLRPKAGSSLAPSNARPSSQQTDPRRAATTQHRSESPRRSVEGPMAEASDILSTVRMLAASPERRPDRISEVLQMTKSLRESVVLGADGITVSHSSLDFSTPFVPKGEES